MPGMELMTPEEIDACMCAARDGEDREAYQRIVLACHHLVRAVMLRDTADPDLADEIAQEVFVRGWLYRHQYRPGTNPKAWLLAIARSRLMEFHRRQSCENRHLRDLIRRELLLRADDARAADEARVEERRLALNDCLGHLSPDQKELLDLVHGQGLATADAAEALGIHPPTCRQRLSRLQRSLRECAESKIGRSHG